MKLEELKENEIRVYYKIGEAEGFTFEKELIKLFEDNGYKFWASGYGCGVRDICFEKKESTAKMIKQFAKEIKNSQVESQDSTKLLDMEIKS